MVPLKNTFDTEIKFSMELYWKKKKGFLGIPYCFYVLISLKNNQES